MRSPGALGNRRAAISSLPRPAIPASRAGRIASPSIRAIRRRSSNWRSGDAIDLVVVGPEAPLVAGVADALRARVSRSSARMPRPPNSRAQRASPRTCVRRTAFPTAGYVRAGRAADARAALDRFGIPVVIKADGLAAGKGVTVAMSRAEAEAAIDAIGDAPLVIEEFLEGEEASLFALVDGETAVAARIGPGPQACRRGRHGTEYRWDGRLRPGARIDARAPGRAMDEIIRPTARAMAEAGTPFSGVLYAGLMLTADGPKLIEYNVRFGDPECEAIMPLIDGDFAELLYAVATGRLGEIDAAIDRQTCSHRDRRGARLSGAPASGGLIREIEAAEQVEGVTVFHAGTASAKKAWSPRADGYLRSRRSPRPSPMPGRAPTAPWTRSTSPTAFTAVTSAGASSLRRAHEHLWTYFWPCFGAGLLCGVIAGIFAFRAPRVRVKAAQEEIAAALANWSRRRWRALVAGAVPT